VGTSYARSARRGTRTLTVCEFIVSKETTASRPDSVSTIPLVNIFISCIDVSGDQSRPSHCIFFAKKVILAETIVPGFNTGIMVNLPLVVYPPSNTHVPTIPREISKVKTFSWSKASLRAKEK
jgi:hypothetical protein